MFVELLNQNKSPKIFNLIFVTQILIELYYRYLSKMISKQFYINYFYKYTEYFKVLKY